MLQIFSSWYFQLWFNKVSVVPYQTMIFQHNSDKFNSKSLLPLSPASKALWTMWILILGKPNAEGEKNGRLSQCCGGDTFPRNGAQWSVLTPWKMMERDVYPYIVKWVFTSWLHSKSHTRLLRCAFRCVCEGGLLMKEDSFWMCVASSPGLGAQRE